MEEIKFSHQYPKLWGQTKATLLDVRILSYFSLHKDLIYYDTRYDGDDGQAYFYPLPHTNLIQLVFVGDKLIPFCTLRRYTVRKFSYYRALLGEEFKIVSPSTQSPKKSQLTNLNNTPKRRRRLLGGDTDKYVVGGFL